MQAWTSLHKIFCFIHNQEILAKLNANPKKCKTATFNFLLYSLRLSPVHKIILLSS